MRELSNFEKGVLAFLLMGLTFLSIHFYLLVVDFSQSILHNTASLLEVQSQEVSKVVGDSVTLADGSVHTAKDVGIVVNSLPAQFSGGILFRPIDLPFLLSTFWVSWVFTIVMVATFPIMFKIFNWDWPVVQVRGYVWSWLKILYLAYAFFSAVFIVSSWVPLFL